MQEGMSQSAQKLVGTRAKRGCLTLQHACMQASRKAGLCCCCCCCCCCCVQGALTVWLAWGTHRWYVPLCSSGPAGAEQQQQSRKASAQAHRHS
jgi:hypothetical protein